PPPVPSWVCTKPHRLRLASKRRITTGLVFTLSAIVSDRTGSPRASFRTARVWTATAKRVLIEDTPSFATPRLLSNPNALGAHLRTQCGCCRRRLRFSLLAARPRRATVITAPRSQPASVSSGATRTSSFVFRVRERVVAFAHDAGDAFEHPWSRSDAIVRRRP